MPEVQDSKALTVLQKRDKALREERKKLIIERYMELGTLSEAAKSIGIDRRTPYEWMERDPEFTEAYLRAKEIVADKLEDHAMKRAYEGSDILTMFLLKGHRPWKYSDNV